MAPTETIQPSVKAVQVVLKGDAWMPVEPGSRSYGMFQEGQIANVELDKVSTPLMDPVKPLDLMDPKDPVDALSLEAFESAKRREQEERDATQRARFLRTPEGQAELNAMAMKRMLDARDQPSQERPRRGA